MVGQRNPIGSAFALIAVLCSLSAIYGLLGSPFIAVLQIVVYAGAIMVLFLFVIMLLNVRREEATAGPGRPAEGRGDRALRAAGGRGRLGLPGRPLRERPQYEASTAKVALELFSPRFLYVFEATSILILAALVGASCSRRRTCDDRDRSATRSCSPRSCSRSERSACSCAAT